MILFNKLSSTTTLATKNYVGFVTEELLNFVAPVLVAGASIALFVWYISPTYKSLPDLRKEINIRTQEMVVLQDKVAQLLSLQVNKDLVVADLTKLSWALEERDKVPELSEQVRLMSKDAGVRFSSLDYTSASRADGAIKDLPVAGVVADSTLYREEKVSVSVNSANLEELIKFLKISENSIRLFDIESLRIGTQDKVKNASLVMLSPYLNPSFSSYSQSSLPINLKDDPYRSFMADLDKFTNYAQKIEATLPKI